MGRAEIVRKGNTGFFQKKELLEGSYRYHSVVMLK